MNLIKFFPIVPALSALALVAAPSTGRGEHQVTVDRDHDGHINQRTFDLSHDHHHYYGRPYFYSRPYPYYGYPYAYGPSVSFSFHRSYSPGYSEGDSNDLAVDVQRELRRRGYYRGSIDGDVGPGTRSAIYNYQADRGLPRTGRIDRYLLRSLGIG